MKLLEISIYMKYYMQIACSKSDICIMPRVLSTHLRTGKRKQNNKTGAPWGTSMGFQQSPRRRRIVEYIKLGAHTLTFKFVFNFVNQEMGESMADA